MAESLNLLRPLTELVFIEPSLGLEFLGIRAPDGGGTVDSPDGYGDGHALRDDYFVCDFA